MIVMVAEVFLQKKGFEWLDRRAVKIPVRLFWYVNLLMVIVLVFRPADSHISLYKTLWDDYDTPAVLYVSTNNPYHRANADLNFYKRKSLAVHSIDSIEKVILPKDSICLVLTSNRTFRAAGMIRQRLVYSSFPSWLPMININHWMDRTYFWYIYELKSASSQ